MDTKTDTKSPFRSLVEKCSDTAATHQDRSGSTPSILVLINTMKNRYRLISRGSRGGAYYCVDGLTGKRTSLRVANVEDAEQIVQAKNQALRQPALNLQIARAYLAGSDGNATSRTWQQVMMEMVRLKEGPTRERWETAIKDKAFDSIRLLPVIETQADHFLNVLAQGTVSTNAYLRRLHKKAEPHRATVSKEHKSEGQSSESQVAQGR